MRYIWSIFIIVAVICANAQTVQRGVVMEYNGSNAKTPLAGVELNVRLASSTVSDKNGNFVLKFATLKPGDRISVRRIEKSGYEIFNKEALETWNLNPEIPFTIIMCRSDKLKKIREEYEAKAAEMYNRLYKKEIAALNKLKSEAKISEEKYRRELKTIKENYERQMTNLDNYIDKFARIDISELSKEEQEVIELIKQGRIEEAIERYKALNVSE